MGNRASKAFSFVLILFIIPAIQAQKISSPNGNLQLKFELQERGIPTYELNYKNKAIISTSRLGLELNNLPSLMEGFSITGTEENSVNENWSPVWGEQSTIKNNYNELLVTLTQQENNGRFIKIRFRMFDDGLGFRYEFPKQQDLNYFVIKEEHTEFSLTGDHKIFWMPGDDDTNEYPYMTSNISDLPELIEEATVQITAQSPIENFAVQTPSMMKSRDGIYINIHEAALVNYPGMNLNVDAENYRMSTHLTPDAVGNKGYMQTPVFQL